MTSDQHRGELPVDSIDRPSHPLWVARELNSSTGKGTRIGVIDSGWDRSRIDDRIVDGAGFVDPSDGLRLMESDDYHDRVGHGTACADLILKIAPDAEICPIRVFGDRLESSVSIIASAIHWAAHKPVRVINMSLGTLLPDALEPLYVACEYASRRGIIIVAAEHNAGYSSFPAAFSNVIGVKAGDFESQFDYIYRRTERAECMARGFNQKVLWLNGCRVKMSGSSFAAPNISGIVALFLERFPEATLGEIRTLLEKYSLQQGRGGALSNRGLTMSA